MMREAANTGEKPVAMKGDTTLLDGTLSAMATVSRGFERGPKATRAPGDPKDSLEEQSRRGRRDRDSDGLTEVYSTGFGDSEEEQKEAMKALAKYAFAADVWSEAIPTFNYFYCQSNIQSCRFNRYFMHDIVHLTIS
jgi:hypothetical protein